MKWNKTVSELCFIADLHFGHTKITEFKLGTRPGTCVEEHDQLLVEAWNAERCQRDVVWVLGDVAWNLESLRHVGRLHGRKRLVLGNHDNLPIDDYLAHFESIHGIVAMRKRTVLSHVPIHIGSLDRWRFNIHGHVHDGSLPDARYINVSVEECPKFAPVTWDAIKQRMATTCTRNRETDTHLGNVVASCAC